MAVAKLGSFITDMAGSIGGTTFKRQKGSLVVMNKNRGATKNKLLQNKGLLSMAGVRAYWNTLNIENRETWVEAAKLVTFKNKFGDNVYISGYQLFIKANGNMNRVENMYENGSRFSKDYTDFTISSPNIVLSLDKCRLNVVNDGDGQYILVRMDRPANYLRKPIYNRSAIMYVSPQNESGTIELWNLFIKKYPNARALQNARFYVSTLNQYGFRSPEKIIETEIQE